MRAEWGALMPVGWANVAAPAECRSLATGRENGQTDTKKWSLWLQAPDSIRVGLVFMQPRISARSSAVLWRVVWG
jgi:hypothetical protein